MQTNMRINNSSNSISSDSNSNNSSSNIKTTNTNTKVGRPRIVLNQKGIRILPNAL